MVFHGRGACPPKQKIVILAEKVRGRMANQDKCHTQEERLLVMDRFSQKLVDFGYTKVNRRDIIKSGLAT